MARTGAIRAGAAFVELFADDSKLVRGLQLASYKLRKFGTQISAMGRTMMMAGAAIAAPLVASAKIFSSAGDRLGKLSKRTGIAVEALSELEFAAERSGSNLDGVEKSVRRMQRSIYDLERGLSTSKDAFGDLGLSLQDLQGLSPDEQFMLIASRLRAVQDASKKAAIAQQLFGRSGTELLPLLDSVEELRQRAHELGLTISTEDAEAAEHFTDVMGDVWRVIRRTGFAVGASLAPTLQDLAGRIVEAGRRARQWVEANQEAVMSVAKLAVALIGGGALLFAVGKLISLLGGLLKAVSFAAKAVHGLGQAFLWLAANPVVGVIALASAAVIGLAYAMDRAQRYTAKLSDEAQKLREEGDGLRKSDRARWQELKRLSEAAELNETQMARARALILGLVGRYGALGISVNEATGKIEGMATAQERLNEAMRQAEIQEVEADVAELRNNLGELLKEGQATAGVKASVLKALTGFGPGLSGKEKLAEMERLGGDIEVIGKRLLASQARLRALQGGAGGLAGEAEGGPAGAGFVPEAGGAEEDWIRRLTQLRLQQIEDQRAREIALINERYDHEMAKAQEALATKETLDAIEEARRLEIAKVVADAEKQAAQERDRLVEDLARDIRDIQIDLLPDEQEREFARLADRYQELIEQAKNAGPEALAQVDEWFRLRQEQIAAGSQAAAEQATSVRGTFSAYAVGGLGTGSATERIAKATEETAKNTGKQADRMLGGGLLIT